MDAKLSQQPYLALAGPEVGSPRAWLCLWSLCHSQLSGVPIAHRSRTQPLRDLAAHTHSRQGGQPPWVLLNIVSRKKPSRPALPQLPTPFLRSPSLLFFTCHVTYEFQGPGCGGFVPLPTLHLVP